MLVVCGSRDRNRRRSRPRRCSRCGCSAGRGSTQRARARGRCCSTRLAARPTRRGARPQIEAREQAVKLRAELEAELRERRDDGRQDRGARHLRRRTTSTGSSPSSTRREQGVADREIHLQAAAGGDEGARATGERRELERIASMTTGEARQRILAESEEQVRHELAGRVRQLEEEAADRGEAPGPQPRRRRAAAGRGERRRRDDRHARRAAVRRHEGPHHRPGGPEHPRARAPHRRRLHHRRHAERRRALVVRRHPARDRAA